MLFGPKFGKNGKKNGNDDREYWNMMNLSSAGLTFFLSIAVGGAIGYYLDKFFGTKPYLFLFFLIMGIIAGFRSLWFVIKKSQHMGDEESQDKDSKKNDTDKTEKK